MINLRDAQILYNAIVTMSGSNICNIKDGDLIRRLDVFNLLNCFFEDGIEIQADRGDDGKIKSYSLHWKSINSEESVPTKQGETVRAEDVLLQLDENSDLLKMAEDAIEVRKK